MTDRQTCSEIREALFELHRRELSDLERTEVDEHLRNCAECRELSEKSADMLEAASRDDIWSIDDPDRLFEAIGAEISGDPTSEDTDEHSRLDELFDAARTPGDDPSINVDADAVFDRVVEELEEPEQTETERDGDDPNHGHWRWIAAAAAAAAVVGWWFALTDAPTDTDRESVSASEHVAESDERSEPSVDSEAPRFTAAFPAMTPVETDRPVRLFADDDADYHYEEGDDADRVVLSGGGILVEYLPSSTSKFSVEANAYTIAVTGTVFSVQLTGESPKVTVFDGSVEITGPDGRTEVLKSGEFIDDGQVAEIDDETYRLVSHYVDLERHRHRWQRAASVAAQESQDKLKVAVDTALDGTERAETQRQRPRPSQPDQPESPPDSKAEDDAPDTAEESTASPRDLHREALQALHRQKPERAAELLERALDKTDSDDRAQADILLELARVQLRELDDTESAVKYLEQFIDQWPDDPAADAVRDRLCEIDPDGVDDAICK